MRTTDRSIPSLDGLRAVSIALVLVSHAAATSWSPISKSAVLLYDFGNLGVRIFFVISGFLITSLLLNEIGSGTISLRRFWMRRILRIVPPYYTLLLITAGLAFSGFIELRPGDLLHAFTFTTNYHYPDRAWYLNHAWSLAVEEQFYLIWPLALVLLGRRFAGWLCLVFVVFAPFHRLSLFLEGQTSAIPNTFGCVGDAIAWGCLLALFRERLWSNALYRRVLHSRLMIVLPLIVLFATGFHNRPRINYMLCFPVMNAGICLLLDWSVANHRSFAGRLLNRPAIAFFGRMSYSLYLWQQIFLVPLSGNPLSSFPLGVAGTVLAAYLSYRFIELPSFALRRRLDAAMAKREKPPAQVAPILAASRPQLGS